MNRYISITRISIITLIAICIIILSGWLFCKFYNPISPLPNINYIGKNKEDIIKMLVDENIKDPISEKILIHIPLGRTVDITQIELSKETRKYIYSQSEWDVNYIYADNKIKGGYYFYRLLFNAQGVVVKQQMKFQSSIGLFGL